MRRYSKLDRALLLRITPYEYEFRHTAELRPVERGRPRGAGREGAAEKTQI